MDTPTGIFGMSKKSALKGGVFSKSAAKPTPFDNEPDDVRERREERELEERLQQAAKNAQSIKIDALLAQVNQMPPEGFYNLPIPPTDPRDVMTARENMNTFFLFRSPPRSEGPDYDANTPPTYGFQSSRIDPIGTGRPSSFKTSSNFKASKHGGIASFNASNNFHSSKPSSAFNASNYFHSSKPSSAFNASNNFHSSKPSSAFNASNYFHSSKPSSAFNASNYFPSSKGVSSSAFNVTNKFSSSSAFNYSNGSTRRHNDSYKTALCNQYKESKTCTYGLECKYAHGIDELRTPPSAKPNYKTVLCRNFLENNECPHGSRCKFIHHRREDNDFPINTTPTFSGSRGRHR